MLDNILRQVFEANWPAFNEQFNKIIADTEVEAAPEVTREPSDILSEILETIRGIDRRGRIDSNMQLPIQKTLFGPGIDKMDDRLKQSAIRAAKAFRHVDLMDELVSYASLRLAEGAADNEVASRILQIFSVDYSIAAEAVAKARSENPG